MPRYLALDALRGLTIALMILVNTPGDWSYVYAPLLHANWHGGTPTDLIFPFFLFIIGSAMFFSFKKINFTYSNEQMFFVAKRGAIMFLIGLALNYFPFVKPLEDLRIMGVLQRIGIAYIAAGAIVLLFNRRGVFIASTVILIAYWILLMSAGEYSAYTLEHNIVRHFDMAVLGSNHMYSIKGIAFDPEGLLSTIPAVVNMLFGFEITRYITSMKDKRQAVIKLCQIGGVAVITGFALHGIMPINKSLWTSTYVIYSSGVACFVLALFIYFIDIKGKEKVVSPLLVYGTNPLFVYVLSWLWVVVYAYIPVGDSNLGVWLNLMLTKVFDPYLASFIYAFVHVTFFWFISLELYKRKIFIKI
jgi:predicted acyltransferase